MTIEWDSAGEIRLRENRGADNAGRCVLAQFDCVDPVVWYRVDATPAS